MKSARLYHWWILVYSKELLHKLSGWWILLSATLSKLCTNHFSLVYGTMSIEVERQHLETFSHNLIYIDSSKNKGFWKQEVCKNQLYPFLF